MSILGAFLFVFLAIIRVAAILRGEVTLLGLLLFLQSSLAATLLVFRRKSNVNAPGWVQWVAWGSALLPMLFSTADRVAWKGILPIPGLLLTLWALISLGTSFGISPASRGLVTTGPYHWLRHPMYAGELLSLLGSVMAVPAWVNLILLAVFIASIFWRIDQEENILNRNGYRAYATVVRWRLVPGVW